MGNNIALDGEAPESGALIQAAEELEYSNADEFLREVLTQIGIGRFKYEPQQRDLNFIKAALSVTVKRMLSKSVVQKEDEDIESSYMSHKIENSAGYKKLETESCEYYLKKKQDNNVIRKINRLDQVRIRKRLKKVPECMVLYLPVERVQINLFNMTGVSDTDPKEEYLLYSKYNKMARFNSFAKIVVTPNNPKKERSGSHKNLKLAQGQGSFAQLFAKELKGTDSLIDPKG